MTLEVVKELQLIQCSLLPGETLVFIDDVEVWNSILDNFTTSGSITVDTVPPSSPPHFQLRVDETDVWFDITMPISTSASAVCQRKVPGEIDESLNGVVLVKGDRLSRDEQMRWQGVVKQSIEEVAGCGAQYPVYELISSHLLPLLHKDTEAKATSAALASANSGILDSSNHEHEVYHALFSSHHLISPTKRRSLQGWSHSLSIQGFAKVGYPGVIYAQGEKESIEDFVGNVKAMQWLALRLRFIEPLPKKFSDVEERQRCGHEDLDGWREVEKVGEVVDIMRRIGREEYVVEMGIGSAGSS